METLDLKEGVLLFYHNCVSSKMLYKVYKLLRSTAKFLKKLLNSVASNEEETNLVKS